MVEVSATLQAFRVGTRIATYLLNPLQENSTMTYEAKIKKALVILSPDLIQPDRPLKSALLSRAIELAKSTGCEIELFHVCFDGGLNHQLTATKSRRQQLKEDLTDRDATLLAEIATRLKQESVKVNTEVRWDHPRTDAILRKIVQSKPDVVMKQSREHSYFLGIASNTDWDLARQSPANVWLVNDEQGGINRLVAAIGSRLADDVDITNGTDHEILRTARSIASAFDAKVYPVNAYQVPTPQNYLASASTVAAPIVPVTSEDNLREQLVKRHGNAIHALVQYFLIAPENVHVCEGDPNRVIPDIAKEVDADMIVLGASSIGRLERLVSTVTVEPVMAQTNCDIFVVRDPSRVSVPDADSEMVYGTPKYDLECAITNPEKTFRSPKEVAKLDEVSVEFRDRILQAWEYDIRAKMAEENEGGPVQDIRVDALDGIRAARKSLGTKNARLDEPAPMSSTASH